MRDLQKLHAHRDRDLTDSCGQIGRKTQSGCALVHTQAFKPHGKDAFAFHGRTMKKTQQIALLGSFIVGRGGGIRTRDPLHPMQVRYQAALRPD